VNWIDGVLILAIVGTIFWIWRKPVILILESLVALIIGILLSSVLLSSILNQLMRWGWRENLYTPAFISLFLSILIWGVFFVLFSSLLPARKPGILSKILALPLAVVFVALLAGLACLVLPPFISSQKLNSSLANSHCCSFIKKSKLMSLPGLKELQGRISEVYTPQNENEIIILPDRLTIGSYEAALSPELFQLISSERTKAGLAPLQYNDDLARLAENYGEEIASSRILSHLSRNGKTPADRANAQKIKFNYLGENLAIAGDIPAAHLALMNSPNHRDNILSPVFRRVGVAIFQVTPSGVLIIEEYTN